MARKSIYLDTIKATLAEHGEMRAKALAAAVGVSDPTLFSAIKTPVIRGEILKRLDGREAFYRLPEQEAGESTHEAPPQFNAALWGDGDLVLCNVELNADGTSITLGPQQVQMLRGLLGA